MNESKKLEDRLIDFAVDVMNMAETLPNLRSGNYIGGQIIRSGTAPALLYGEVRGAESKKDFIHKMKIALKELRETLISLKIIIKKQFPINLDNCETLKSECNELVSIFVSSTKTADKNLKIGKNK
ncbi:MAG: four helix bundle protein [Candidatus Marinimicrobia bacterium]|nr:four helix bundle protein [Candidatus Neomarinimicrobiota bacterium]MBL7010941.1 four helix bundle protein [Candidatus Neomarinimicrobiota bacterium]MBL7030896.1 four helix bundle protein [Candidatus Neomarinimicrobiota bacterium]